MVFQLPPRICFRNHDADLKSIRYPPCITCFIALISSITYNNFFLSWSKVFVINVPIFTLSFTKDPYLLAMNAKHKVVPVLFS